MNLTYHAGVAVIEKTVHRYVLARVGGGLPRRNGSGCADARRGAAEICQTLLPGADAGLPVISVSRRSDTLASVRRP
jgi:hypothetical protein